MTGPARAAPHPAEALRDAVKANDARRVADVLARHPELRSALDEPLPDDHFGATPLLGAVNGGNREMVDVLLHAGADINARSHWWAGGFGVLDHDGPLVTHLIERGARIDAHVAARLGMIEKLDQLISADPALVHARGGDGQMPLHMAASVEIARYLLDRGAAIDARDIDHESTPAQYMVRDRQDVARYLVERGCRTDILMAAALGHLDLVREHLDANPASVHAKVSERDFPKQDPRSGGTIYVWTLGADKTAHVVAREFGHDAVFRLLMDRSPAALKLAVACGLGDRATVDALLEGRPDLVQTLSDDERRTLPDAARDEKADAVRLMLSIGWPLNARGQHGATALHWAAFHGDTAVVRALLRHQPPLEIKSEDFDGTPLDWALYGAQHGWRCQTGDYAGTVDALLAAGAALPTLPDAADESQPIVAVVRRHAAARAQG